MLKRRALLTAFLILTPVTAWAQKPSEQLVQELYTKSGMEKQIEQLPLIIQAGLDQAAPEDEHLQELPDQVKTAMRQLVPQVFAPEIMKQVMIQEISGGMANADVMEVLAWLESSTGKYLTRCEEAASTPEAQAAIDRFAAALPHSPPPEERLDLFRRLDAAMKATETSVDLTIGIELAVAAAVIATLPADQQKSLDDLARELEKGRPFIEASMRSRTLVSFLYTYRDASKEDLERYVGFAKSAAGSKYHAVTSDALKKGLFQCSVQWGKAIADTLLDSKSPSGA